MAKQASTIKSLASSSAFAGKAFLSRFASTSEVVAAGGIASDSFGVVGTLSGRYTETGNLPWQGVNNSISAAIGGSNRVQISTAIGAYVDTGSNDISLSWTVYFTATGSSIGAMIRWVDSSNLYFVGLLATTTSPTLALKKIVGGIVTTLATVTPTSYTSATAYPMRVDVIGSQWFIYFNGSLVITYTEPGLATSMFPAATKHGFRADSSQTGLYIDDAVWANPRGTGCEITTSGTLRSQSASANGFMEAVPTISSLTSLKSVIPSWKNATGSNSLTSVQYSLDGGVTYSPFTNGVREYFSALAISAATAFRLRYQLSRSGIIDTVNRVDSALSPGSADTGESWTADLGVWGVSSKRLYLVSAAASIGRVLMNTNNRVVDFSFEAMMASTPGSGTPYFGLHLRNLAGTASTGSTANFIEINITNAAVTVYKCVAGTYTQISSAVSLATPSDVYMPWRVTVDAANLVTIYRAGTSIFSQTVSDSSFNNQTYHGFRLDVSSWTVALNNRYRNLSFYDATGTLTELESFAMALEY